MTLTLEAIISEISSVLGANFHVLAGPLRGGSNTVYEIQSENGKNRWCLRIPLDADAAFFSIKGTAVLRDVKERLPALPAPAIIYQSENYTVMEYVDGQILKSWNTQSIAKDRRRLLLDGLAAFLFSLWTPGVHAPQGTEYKVTYREWLKSEVDRGLRRTLQGTSVWGDPICYLFQRMKIDDLVPSPDDGASGIKHGDLNAWNVIVSEKGLSGIVDWDTARLVPAPSAVQHPLFIADIPGWQNDNVPQGMAFEEDRAYLENAIRKSDAGSPNPGRIEHLLRTSFERQFFELSLHNRRINNEYIQRHFKDTKSNRNAALQQLEDFLSVHELMRNLPVVLDVQKRLNRDLSQPLFDP